MTAAGTVPVRERCGTPDSRRMWGNANIAASDTTTATGKISACRELFAVSCGRLSSCRWHHAGAGCAHCACRWRCGRGICSSTNGPSISWSRTSPCRRRRRGMKAPPSTANSFRAAPAATRCTTRFGVRVVSKEARLTDAAAARPWGTALLRPCSPLAASLPSRRCRSQHDPHHGAAAAPADREDD